MRCPWLPSKVHFVPVWGKWIDWEHPQKKYSIGLNRGYSQLSGGYQLNSSPLIYCIFSVHLVPLPSLLSLIPPARLLNISPSQGFLYLNLSQFLVYNQISYFLSFYFFYFYPKPFPYASSLVIPTEHYQSSGLLRCLLRHLLLLFCQTPPNDSKTNYLANSQA